MSINIEDICGRELSLDEFKSTLPGILSYITNGKIRVFIYNVEPPERTFCVLRDVAFSHHSDILLKMACVDGDGITYNTTSVAMDHFIFVYVATAKMKEEMKHSKPVTELSKIVRKITRTPGMKRKLIKIYLYLTKNNVKLETNLDVSLSKPIIDWFRKWVINGYTPVLLFELLVMTMRENNLIVVPNLVNLDNDFVINLLY